MLPCEKSALEFAHKGCMWPLTSLYTQKRPAAHIDSYTANQQAPKSTYLILRPISTLLLANTHRTKLPAKPTQPCLANIGQYWLSHSAALWTLQFRLTSCCFYHYYCCQCRPWCSGRLLQRWDVEACGVEGAVASWTSCLLQCDPLKCAVRSIRDLSCELVSCVGAGQSSHGANKVPRMACLLSHLAGTMVCLVNFP